MGGQRAILLAEDDENDVFLFKRALARAGLASELIVARDGQEAVEFLSRNGSVGTPEQVAMVGLFLLDLKMPRLNGFDVLAWLATQAKLKDLPVVVFSSSSHDGDMAQARKLGARDYRVKPADFVTLVELVKELHAQWLDDSPAPNKPAA